MRVTVHLTGAREGKTISLRRYNFVKGQYVVEGSAQEVDSTLRYLSRVYKAFPLEEFKAWKEAQNGAECTVPEAPEQRSSEAVQGGVGEPAGGVQTSGDVQRDGPVGGEAGSEGLGTGGSGHTDAGLQPDQVAKIKTALTALDVKNDAHWTSDGLPAVEAVSDMLRDQGITRKVIETVAPEWTREKALEALEL